MSSSARTGETKKRKKKKEKIPKQKKRFFFLFRVPSDKRAASKIEILQPPKLFHQQTNTPRNTRTQHSDIMASINSNTLSFTEEEQKTLHWDGIVAVCTGKFKNLAEAKEHLGKVLVLKKTGLRDEILNAFEKNSTSGDMWLAIHSGQKWGDIWYDSAWADLESTKKELRKTYVDLAMADETEGRWRIGAKKIQLEERLLGLQKDLGMSEA